MKELKPICIIIDLNTFKSSKRAIAHALELLSFDYMFISEDALKEQTMWVIQEITSHIKSNTKTEKYYSRLLLYMKNQRRDAVLQTVYNLILHGYDM